MKKILLKIIVVLILLITVLSSLLLRQGYLRYQEEIENKPIEVLVNEYRNNDNYVEFNELSKDFINAVISVEDKRFFERKGYDFIALFRAIYHNFKARNIIEGGSTISEQIAKNLYLGGYVEGLQEKIAEIFIMNDLEKHYSKEVLFALYVNMNYYGDSYYGIYEAANGYYGINPNQLSLAQAAILAGLPNAPSIYQLSSGFDLAKDRQLWVLQTMYNNGFISESQINEAYLEDVSPRKD